MKPEARVLQVVEYSVRYDGGKVEVEGCQISETNAGATCSIEIDVDE